MKKLCLLLVLATSGCFFLPLMGCGPESLATSPRPKKPEPRQSVKELEKEVAALRSEKSTVDGKLRAKEQELTEARRAQTQRRLFWLMSIAIFVFIVAVALAIFVRAIRKICIIVALVALAIAGLAKLAAWLLPYLLIIGIVVVVAFVAFAIYYWRADEKSRDQIVTAVDKYKDRFDEKAKGWRKHFRKFISKGSHKLIRKTRKGLGLPIEEA